MRKRIKRIRLCSGGVTVCVVLAVVWVLAVSEVVVAKKPVNPPIAYRVEFVLGDFTGASAPFVWGGRLPSSHPHWIFLDHLAVGFTLNWDDQSHQPDLRPTSAFLIEGKGQLKDKIVAVEIQFHAIEDGVQGAPHWTEEIPLCTDPNHTECYSASWPDDINWDDPPNDFKLHVHADNVEVWEMSGLHQGSQVRMVGTLSVGDLEFCIEGSGNCPPSGTGGALPESTFLRGDSNADGDLNITDPVHTLGYLFLGGPAPSCPDAADSDDNGRVEISDPVFTLNWLFLGHSEPPPPGSEACGTDATEDALTDCNYDPARC